MATMQDVSKVAGVFNPAQETIETLTKKLADTKLFADTLLKKNEELQEENLTLQEEVEQVKEIKTGEIREENQKETASKEKSLNVIVHVDVTKVSVPATAEQVKGINQIPGISQAQKDKMIQGLTTYKETGVKKIVDYAREYKTKDGMKHLTTISPSEFAVLLSFRNDKENTKYDKRRRMFAEDLIHCDKSQIPNSIVPVEVSIS